MDEETPAYVCDMSLCPPSGVKRTQAVHTRHDSDVPARPPDCLVSRVDRTFSGRHRMAENDPKRSLAVAAKSAEVIWTARRSGSRQSKCRESDENRA